MSSASRGVTADPFYQCKEGSCQACGQNDKKRPCSIVTLTHSQLTKRASIDTSPLPNPFSSLESGPIRLCTDCRKGNKSWTVIVDVKHYGRKSVAALQSWKTRCVPTNSPKRRTCYICAQLSASGKTEFIPSAHQLEREPRRYLTVFKVLLFDEEAQSTFCEHLSDHSGASNADCRFLLHRIAETHFCSVHHNHARHAIDAASRVDSSLRGTKMSYCIFYEHGCLRKSAVLRPMPRFEIKTLEDMEAYFEYQESVESLSSSHLCVEDVAGKQACSTCRFIVSKGTCGTRPNIDVSSLQDAADRCLVDCILYSLEGTTDASKFFHDNGIVLSVADKMRSKIMAPFPEVPSSRFLPFTEIVSARGELNELSSNGADIGRKTVEARIGPVLSARGVQLYSLSRKLRCYAKFGSLSDTVHSVITIAAVDEVFLKPAVRRKLLATVSKRFRERHDGYRRGHWSLSEEVCAIPRELWASFIFDMASNKQLAVWKLKAESSGRALTELFPICNDEDKMPRSDLDNFAEASLRTAPGDDAITRSDFLLVLRALKVIEQIVYSRSRLCVGPLTLTLAVAGMLEMSASWTSVLHALGLITSYESTADFRKELIAEREQSERGAFNNVSMHDKVVSIQIDNFDILPFHSVKAAGKSLPMISGTATQAIVRGKKRRRILEHGQYVTTGTPSSAASAHSIASEIRDDVWLDPRQAIADRKAFIASFNTAEDAEVLTDFCNVAFGVVHEHREKLLDAGPSVSSYKRGRNEKMYKHQGMGFRSLMLSCFKQHGGNDPDDAFLYDQDVLFVDISRMSASDILTIHEKVSLIKALLTPGENGCPRFVIICGDQPTYRMLVKIWRNSYLNARRGGSSESDGGAQGVHEWMIPFPGLFHLEKQSMYPICKEMLDGMGLYEFAACCGLTKSQVDNILNHGHARNNRTVLFNLCAALIIHLCDLILTECPDLKDQLDSVTRINIPTAASPDCMNAKKSKLLRCTTDQVKAHTIDIGRLLRERVAEFFKHSPNGKHIVNTVLFTCLIPTVGFHVLSRTGHTDVSDSFWMRMNNILHTSGHLNYQELYLFHAFFRAIMPRVAFEDLYSSKPGAMVARVPTFTAGLGRLYDRRGWVYVHLDESLEMLIIRQLKSLNAFGLQYLESAGAWMLVSSRAKMIIRTVTASTRSYNRVRHDESAGDELNPLSQYDRSSIQTSIVRDMVELMRRKGFLSNEHRNCPKLRNVLGDSPQDLNDSDAQRLILDVENYGGKTSELHASAMMPDVFGPLTDQDLDTYFGGKRLKGTWTKSRRVPTVRSITESQELKSTAAPAQIENDPKMSIADRRRKINKLMTNLTLAQNSALEDGDLEGAGHARRRWNDLHAARHLLSPYADAYKSSDGSVRHPKKSQMISALNLHGHESLDGADRIYEIARARNRNVAAQSSEEQARIASFYYGYRWPQYATVMVDLMNQVWARGVDGSRGNSLFNVTVLKLKHFLAPRFAGRCSRNLKQLHLHIDDPTCVIPQKRGEQERRDKSRSSNEDTCYDDDLTKFGFHIRISTPWTTLIRSRLNRDAICSLHLFCGAVAANELARDNNLDVTVYLYGGCFCFTTSCIGADAESLEPELASRMEQCENPRSGEVMLRLKRPSMRVADDSMLTIPRDRVLIYSNSNGLEISDAVVQHGESETRFVAAFKKFVNPMLAENGWSTGETSESEHQAKCGSLILSKDTDVTIILALATTLHGQGILHLLGDTVINVDILVNNLQQRGLPMSNLAAVYVLAGCDFSPATYGVTHEHYLRAAMRYKDLVETIDTDTGLSVFELLTLLAYLEKHGIMNLANVAREESLIDVWSNEGCDPSDISKLMKQTFTSTNAVGSEEWCLDVRRFISDVSKITAELAPHRKYVWMQGRRVKMVVFKYWAKAHCDSLTTSFVGGCEEAFGFNESGGVIVEREEDVRALAKQLRGFVAKCGCKGKCNTRQCSCVKCGRKCIGCDCNALSCANKLTKAPVNAVDYVDDNIYCNAGVAGNSRNDECNDSNIVTPEQAEANDFENLPPLNTEMDFAEVLGLL